MGSTQKNEAEEFAYETLQYLRKYTPKAFEALNESSWAEGKRWGKNWRFQVIKYCNFILENLHSLEKKELKKRFDYSRGIEFIEFFACVSFSDFQKMKTY